MSTLIERAYYDAISREDWHWIRALARTESSENPAAVGDDGLSTGLFQMHPTFRRQWSREVLTGMDLISDGLLLRAFWNHYRSRFSELETCLIFHLGYLGYTESGDPNRDGYADRLNDNVTDEE